MDQAQLRALIAVARHASFSGAATELQFTQPGVSRQVQKLERELGVTLVVRRRDGVTLTPAGEQVYAYALDALARHADLLRALAASPPTLAGDLRIAASTTPGEFVVPDLVAAFCRQYPAVHPRVAISDTTTVVEDVLRGAADLGFTGARLPRRGLQYEEVIDDEVVLAVPAGHHLVARAAGASQPGRIALADLAGERFIQREGGSGTLLSVRRILAAHGLRPPRHQVAMELSTTQAIVSAVEGGHGIGWVSALALAGRDPSRVQSLRLANLDLLRPLYLLISRTHPESALATAFITSVRSGFRAVAHDRQRPASHIRSEHTPIRDD